MSQFWAVAFGLWPAGPGTASEVRRESAAPVLAAVRAAAAGALATFWPIERAVVIALERALRDPDPAVRREAANSLASFGPEAAPALPGLVAAPPALARGLGASDPLVRKGCQAVFEHWAAQGGSFTVIPLTSAVKRL